MMDWPYAILDFGSEEYDDGTKTYPLILFFERAKDRAAFKRWLRERRKEGDKPGGYRK